MVYSVPAVTSVRPEEAPRWGSFGLTVFLEDDVLNSTLDSVRPSGHRQPDYKGANQKTSLKVNPKDPP